LTVRENLELPLRLSRKDPGTRIESLLESLDIAAKAEAFPERLSGGEQQRVAVARALVHQPTLVLADEPTGNLDLDTGLLVVSLLDRLVRESGATLIMATHSRQVIGYADRVVTIRDGHLEDT
jgi:putative ABC transport system ATP-binding protein